MKRWTIILLTTLFLCPLIRAELVHRYSFNDDTCDDMIGDAHGTLVDTSGQSYFEDGKLYLENDVGQTNDGTHGGAWVELPPGMLNTLTSNQITIEMWLGLLRGGSSDDTWNQTWFIFGENLEPNTKYMLKAWQRINSNSAFYCLKPNYWGVWTDQTWMEWPMSPINEPIHFVMVHYNPWPPAWNDKGYIKIYINGQLTASSVVKNTWEMQNFFYNGPDTAGVPRPTMLNPHNYLGRGYEANRNLFDGWIDDFRIYDHAMSDNEVLARYYAGTDPNASLAIRTTGTLTVSEVGPTSTTYDILRLGISDKNVNIIIRPDEQIEINHQGAGQPVEVTLLGGDALASQTVTITAMDDHQPEGSHWGHITHTVRSEDATYDGAELEDLSVAIGERGWPSGLKHRYTFDNDCQDVTSGADGILINPSGRSRYENGQLILANRSGVTNGTFPDYVKLPAGVISGLGNSGSFEFWVTFDSQEYWQALFSWGTYTRTYGQLDYSEMFFYRKDWTYQNDDFSSCRWRAGSTFPMIQMPLIPYGQNKTQIVLVFDNDDTLQDGNTWFYCYVNGQLWSRTDNSDGRLILSSLLDADNWLGRGFNRNWPAFIGRFDEVRLYNRALSADEARASYHKFRGNPWVQISPGDGLNATEDGLITDTYTIACVDIPLTPVIVTIDPDPQVEVNHAGAGNPIQLTFTPENAITPQTVTVTAAADGVPEGEHTGTITHSTQSGDPDFNQISLETLNVTLGDSLTESPLQISRFSAQTQLTGNRDSCRLVGTFNPITQTVSNVLTLQVGPWTQTIATATDHNFRQIGSTPRYHYSGTTTGGERLLLLLDLSQGKLTLTLRQISLDSLASGQNIIISSGFFRIQGTIP